MELAKIFNNEMDGLTEEEKKFAKEFNEKLRDNIIEELVIYEGDELIKKLNSNKEEYYDAIRNLVVNGVKGYKEMNLKQLIDIYLAKKSDEDFINLINK